MPVTYLRSAQDPSGTPEAISRAEIAVFLLLVGAPAARAQEQPAAEKLERQGFSASDVQILYGWHFKEPDISVGKQHGFEVHVLDRVEPGTSPIWVAP